MRAAAVEVARSVVCLCVVITTVSCAKTAEQIDTPFWELADSREPNEPMGAVCWHHLANTIERLKTTAIAIVLRVL